MESKTKKQISNRLKRIEGQVRGLARMVDSEKYCVDIITQSFAVKEALAGVESLLLKNHLSTHVVKQMKSGKTEKATAEILKVYKLSRRK